MSHRFEKQATAWLAGLEVRKRRPVSPATLDTYRSHIQRLLPLVGADTLLTDINNGFLKSLAEKVPGSAKTINESLMALKQIVASAVDPQSGDQIYPRIWNHVFIDAPTIENQKQPSLTVEQVNAAIKNARSWQEQTMYAILAGTGLRISECLAIRVGPVAEDQTAFLEAEGIIKIRASIWHNQEYRGKLKTKSSKRDVDLDPRLPSRIGEFARAHKIEPGEFLFQSECGDVANVETITRRLAQRKVPGFHSFRRFRISRLRELGTPEDVLRYWVGHSGQGITDRYSKLAENVELRKQWAMRTGLGFTVEHLGHPTRRRKRQSRIERYNALLKADTKPSYQATDSDVPDFLLAPAAL